MGIFETFSKRAKRAKQSGQKDVYQYDKFPPEFRKQVIFIWRDAIGPFIPSNYASTESPSNKQWTYIHNALARELGVFNLGDPHDNFFAQCSKYLLTTANDGVLDIIDMSFKVIDGAMRGIPDWKKGEMQINQNPDGAINELNHRFREHSIGFQFQEGQLIRVDSEYVHSTIVRPAINLLQQPGFKGPSEEFLKAHEHYRKNKYKEAIINLAIQ